MVIVGSIRLDLINTPFVGMRLLLHTYATAATYLPIPAGILCLHYYRSRDRISADASVVKRVFFFFFFFLPLLLTSEATLAITYRHLTHIRTYAYTG